MKSLFEYDYDHRSLERMIPFFMEFIVKIYYLLSVLFEQCLVESLISDCSEKVIEVGLEMRNFLSVFLRDSSSVDRLLILG